MQLERLGCQAVQGVGERCFHPFPDCWGSYPLTSRVCQYKCGDMYIQDRRASVSLCDLIRCQNIVYLQCKYRHVRKGKYRSEGIWDSERGGQLMFIQLLVL